MQPAAPTFAVSLHRHLTVVADDAEGELLAIGWSAPGGVEAWSLDDFVYLVLDRRTGRPAWVGQEAVRAIRHERE